MFTIDTCSGLHGHNKVSPADGTVYVPDKGCGGETGAKWTINGVPFPCHENSKQAVIISEDNAATWTPHPVSTSTGNDELANPADGSHQTKSDAAVGIA